MILKQAQGRRRHKHWEEHLLGYPFEIIASKGSMHDRHHESP
jgi:hypothetical protein